MEPPNLDREQLPPDASTQVRGHLARATFSAVRITQQRTALVLQELRCAPPRSQSSARPGSAPGQPPALRTPSGTAAPSARAGG